MNGVENFKFSDLSSLIDVKLLRQVEEQLSINTNTPIDVLEVLVKNKRNYFSISTTQTLTTDMFLTLLSNDECTFASINKHHEIMLKHENEIMLSSNFDAKKELAKITKNQEILTTFLESSIELKYSCFENQNISPELFFENLENLENLHFLQNFIKNPILNGAKLKEIFNKYKDEKIKNPPFEDFFFNNICQRSDIDFDLSKEIILFYLNNNSEYHKATYNKEILFTLVYNKEFTSSQIIELFEYIVDYFKNYLLKTDDPNAYLSIENLKKILFKNKDLPDEVIKKTLENNAITYGDFDNVINHPNTSKETLMILLKETRADEHIKKINELLNK